MWPEKGFTVCIEEDNSQQNIGRYNNLLTPEINEKTMLGLNFVPNPAYEDYVESDRQARAFAQSLVKK